MHCLKRTWAEISLDNLHKNIENFKKYLDKQTDLLCVVKANCYGHCDEAVVPYLENDMGIKWFAVSNLSEGLKLRKIGIKGEILILGYTPPCEAGSLSDYNIIQACTEYKYAQALNKYSDGKTVRIHIAVDTGMTRIGLRGTTAEICDDIQKITRLKSIKTEGIFTHFAVADSDDSDDIEYTQKQAEKIIEVDNELKNRGVMLEQCHFLNSAGGVYYYNKRSSLARLGIILYGLTPNPKKALPFIPLPVMSLKSCVSQVKVVEKGACVSYGRTYKTDKQTTLATITCGYADGYPRLLSNIGEVIIKGKRAKIVGRVCMDQFMCDVSHIDGVKSGDTVTLIGKDGNEIITADDIADLTGTIGYEIVCGISARVPRVIIKDNKETTVFN